MIAGVSTHKFTGPKCSAGHQRSSFILHASFFLNKRNISLSGVQFITPLRIINCISSETYETPLTEEICGNSTF